MPTHIFKKKNEENCLTKNVLKTADRKLANRKPEKTFHSGSREKSRHIFAHF